MKGVRRGKGAEGQGMNWIRPEKRLAIYLRDGLACVWCGTPIEENVTLTLDHLRVFSRGGGNEASNLVTACKRCNSRRGTRTVKRFARTLGRSEAILARIEAVTELPLPVAQAKRLIASRGGFSAALKGARP